MSLKRREFLGIGTAVVAGTAIAPGVRLIELAQARSPEEAASAKQRWGMLIDTNKCAKGCTSCVEACHTENGVKGHNRPATDQQWIRKIEAKDPSTGKEYSLPMMCQHCEDAPCIDVCPTGASMRRDDGIVLVDRHICIGCRYCMIACPYKARSFAHETVEDPAHHAPRGKGTVESCTLCVHKVDRGDGTTACAEACNKAGHEAILFGDLMDPDSKISKRLRTEPSRQIRADLNLNTAVRYKNI